MKGETLIMKKFLCTVIVFISITCMVACNKSTTAVELDTVADIPVNSDITTTVKVPAIPKLSDEFNESALQFLLEFSNKNCENLAAEVIQLSDGYANDLFSYLNYYLVHKYGEEIKQYFGCGNDSVKTVDVFIHNYDSGNMVGCVSFNDHEAVYNYTHDNILLAASVTHKYPDNLTLAKARITSYVLLQMSCEEIQDCCIVTSGEKESYNLDLFNNKAFYTKACDVLESQ